MQQASLSLPKRTSRVTAVVNISFLINTPVVSPVPTKFRDCTLSEIRAGLECLLRGIGFIWKEAFRPAYCNPVLLIVMQLLLHLLQWLTSLLYFIYYLLVVLVWERFLLCTNCADFLHSVHTQLHVISLSQYINKNKLYINY